MSETGVTVGFIIKVDIRECPIVVVAAVVVVAVTVVVIVGRDRKRVVQNH
jgi:hypothetical protein